MRLKIKPEQILSGLKRHLDSQEAAILDALGEQLAWMFYDDFVKPLIPRRKPVQDVIQIVNLSFGQYALVRLQI